MPIRVGVISDVHLEFGEYNGDLGAGDVLLLAGDINVAAYIHATHPSILSHDMKGRSERLYERALQSYDHIIEVSGNHEHYHGILQATPKIKAQHFGHIDRLHFLEKEAVQIKGVNFFGATLWTDFNRNDPFSKRRAQEYMNDYQSIKVFDDQDLMEQRALHPEDVYAEHLATLMDLNDIVKESKADGRKLVVVGHHAPSKRSIHPRYINDYAVNGSYSSDLEHLMGPHIPLWVHGHTHDSYDYTVRDTRIICNPRGYVGHHLNPHFKPTLEVVIDG